MKSLFYAIAIIVFNVIVANKIGLNELNWVDGELARAKTATNHVRISICGL